MTEYQYVNAIVKKVRCSNAKKKDIRKQLLADINMRVEQGEKIEDVMEEMGTIDEIAESFNENISDEEKKSDKRRKRIKAAVSIIFVLVLLVCFIYWILPKIKDVNSSKIFSEKKIETAVKETIEKFNKGDYEALQKNSTTQMKGTFEKETIESAKRMISDNWGERQRFGKIYIQEVEQGKSHYAVSQMTVTYENVSVTFTITFDKNMKLAGLYMK